MHSMTHILADSFSPQNEVKRGHRIILIKFTRAPRQLKALAATIVHYAYNFPLASSNPPPLL